MSNTGWIILRTAGQSTLPLTSSLSAAGIEAWSPRRTIRRPVPGQRRKLALGLRLTMRDLDVPILTTFVFARAEHTNDLFRLAAIPFKPHADFSVYRIGDRVPVLGDAAIAGLREAEAEAMALIKAQRDADTRAEAEAIRIAAIKNEAARRRAMNEAERQRREALRQARRDIPGGTQVVVDDHPAFAGVDGIAVSSAGPHTWVQLGNMTWKIETWRLTPRCVCEGKPNLGAAA